jgi:hypothetical protein
VKTTIAEDGVPPFRIDRERNIKHTFCGPSMALWLAKRVERGLV